MDFLKSLFEQGPLTWEQFSQAVTSKGYKVADLATGNYVSKLKYDDDIKTRDTTISELNTQISNRDIDISTLQTQLSDASKDADTKLADLTTQLNTLSTNYETQRTDYEKKLATQKYEFAVKDFANNKKFSSNAAKRDFIKEMTSANLTMQNDVIMGADDFADNYMKNNSDAFVVEQPNEPDTKPSFVMPTVPTPNPGNDNAFIQAFNFTGVRPHDTK